MKSASIAHHTLVFILVSSALGVSCEVNHPCAQPGQCHTSADATMASATSPSESPLAAAPSAPAPSLVFEVKDPNAPALIILHGYGSNQEDLSELGQLAQRLGWYALSVPAPEVLGPKRYSWPKNSPLITHAYLQAQLGTYGLATRKVYLAGFSQGALHSAWLVATYPTRYAGVLAISPGGWVEGEPSLHATTTPLCLVGGRAELPRHRAKFDALAKVWRAAGAPLKIWEHQGGHHFPPSWRADFTQCLQELFSSQKL